MGASNNTGSAELPSFELRLLPALLPWFSDFHLALILPPLAYWALSGFYFILDTFNLFADCRIHSPAETRQRNRVSASQVIRAVLIQQSSQIALGLAIGSLLGTEQFCGREGYEIAQWVEWVRRTREALPLVLNVAGIDSRQLSRKLVGILSAISPKGPAGGIGMETSSVTSADHWTAQAIYYYLGPAVRFTIAVLVADAWQYAMHRAMHSSKWLYRTCSWHRASTLSGALAHEKRAGNFHANHHRFVVPYAFGAFYATWAEGFLMDGVGTTLALGISGLTTRQAMWFNTISTLKGVDDHGGYDLPYNPLQWLGQQDTVFHDVHHQSWGNKVSRHALSLLEIGWTEPGGQSNYSQLYLTLWDHLCGTVNPMSDAEVKRQYSIYRSMAEQKEQEATKTQ